MIEATIIHERGARRKARVDDKVFAMAGRVPCVHVQDAETSFPNTWWIFNLNTGPGDEVDVRSWSLDPDTLRELRRIAGELDLKVVPRVAKVRAQRKKRASTKKQDPRQLSFGEG